MMIEAVPFFHILVNIIQTEVGDNVSLKCDAVGPHTNSLGRGDHFNDNDGVCILVDSDRTGVFRSRCFQARRHGRLFPATHSRRVSR